MATLVYGKLKCANCGNDLDLNNAYWDKNHNKKQCANCYLIANDYNPDEIAKEFAELAKTLIADQVARQNRDEFGKKSVGLLSKHVR